MVSEPDESTPESVSQPHTRAQPEEVTQRPHSHDVAGHKAAQNIAVLWAQGYGCHLPQACRRSLHSALPAVGPAAVTAVRGTVSDGVLMTHPMLDGLWTSRGLTGLSVALAERSA